MNNEALPIRAIPLSVTGLLKALGETPIRGPWPSLGVVIGQEVQIPHFFKPAENIRVNDFEPLTIGSGDRVIVYTQGDVEKD